MTITSYLIHALFFLIKFILLDRYGADIQLYTTVPMRFHPRCIKLLLMGPFYCLFQIATMIILASCTIPSRICLLSIVMHFQNTLREVRERYAVLSFNI